jgi:cyclic-di-AMP phosphodiesterase PgpH
VSGEVKRLRDATVGWAESLRESRGTYRAALVVAVFLVLTLAFSLDLAANRFTGVRVGQPSLRTVRAPASAAVVDSAATAMLKDRAAAAVGPQFTLDPTAMGRSIEAVDAFFAFAAHMRRPGLTPSARLIALRAVVPTSIPDAALSTALALPSARLEADSLETRRLVGVLLLDRVTPADVGRVAESLEGAAAASKLPIAERGLIAAVGASALGPTFREDEALRGRLKAEARTAVATVVLRVTRGDVIVRQGSVVTRQELVLMRALGLDRTRIDIARFWGAAMLVVLGMAAVGVYLKQADAELYASTAQLTIMAVLLVMIAVFGKIAGLISPMLPMTVLPIVAAPMLATLLGDPKSGLVTAVAATAVIAGSTSFSASLMMWALLSCVFAVFSVARVSRRQELYRAGLLVMFSSGAIALAVALYSGVSGREALSEGFFGVLGGLVGTVFTIGLLPFFESVFGITTDVKLADLINPNQPLLRELASVAPGTYTHSLTVANLAEAAAEDIGADAMLARAGAYYHDVGKMKRPSFFVENQIAAAENPHDHTNPRLSFLVIAAHLKQGIELAEEQHLPAELIDIIRQHHGTSIVQYFYQRAIEQEGYGKVKEQDFRYEGVKPQSREAAIVMLADATEAATRTLVKPTPQRIEQTVKKIVAGRVDDGQLDESHLTMCDLDTIGKSFTRVLAGAYHGRIEYPEITSPASRKAVRDGSSG